MNQKRTIQLLFVAGFLFLIVLGVLATVDVMRKKSGEKERGERFQEEATANLTEEQIAEFEKKRAEFEAMIAENPERVIPYVSLASVEKSLGNLERAEEILVRAAQIAPKNYLILGNLADIYRELGENEKADVAYARALHLNPLEQQNYLQYAEFLRYRYPERHEKILEIYNQGIQKLTHDVVDIYRALATYYEERGDREKAIETWAIVLEKEPENEQVRQAIEELKARVK